MPRSLGDVTAGVGVDPRSVGPPRPRWQYEDPRGERYYGHTTGLIINIEICFTGWQKSFQRTPCIIFSADQTYRTESSRSKTLNAFRLVSFKLG